MPQFIAGIFDKWVDAVYGVLNRIIDLLPDSPFVLIDNSPIEDYLGWLNWLIPMTQIIAILQLWVVAIAVYYVWVVILRWVKAID